MITCLSITGAFRDFQSLATSTSGYTHPFRESKRYPGLVTKLDRSMREYLELEKDDEFEYNPENINNLILRYIWNANIDCWYTSPDCDDFTPKSYIFQLPATGNELSESLPVDFFPKFVRLNSVNPKYLLPVYSVKEALEHIHGSERCKNVMELYTAHKFPKSQGVEYRCFLYKDKLTAICTNDTKARQSLSDEELLHRIQLLVKRNLGVRTTTLCKTCL